MTDIPKLTPGTDSYISYEQAETIAANRLFTEAWQAATPERRAQALKAATALLDRQRWAGLPKLLTQPLAWPRSAIRDASDFPVPADTIPAPVATACVELAFHLLTAGQLPAAPVQMRQLGDGMTMYFPTIADELPKHVRRLIEPFLRIQSANVAEVLL